MASNVGRGRGYSGKNKDIVRTFGNTSDSGIIPSNSVSQRILKNQHGSSDSYNVDQFDDEELEHIPISTVPPVNHKNAVSVTMDNPRNKPKMASAGGTPGYNQENVKGIISSNQMIQNSAGLSKQTVMKSYEDSENTLQYGRTNVHILNKPSETKNNTQRFSQEEKHLSEVGNVSDDNSQSVLYIEEKHGFLIKQVSLLSSRDDGILTNQKLQHIEGILTKTCTNPFILRSALDAIASAALLNSRMAIHVSLMCCSMWFTRAQLLGLRLHHVFMVALTDKIDGLEVSLQGADQYLVNAASLLEDIFTKSKMMGSEDITSIARLIVQVCIELLECNTQLALRTLNFQLMSHGPKLYKSVPSKVESLSISARKLLIARQPPPPACRIWLTLLADQCIYRLEPLPKYLQDFYSVLLDESSSAQEHDIQKEKITSQDDKRSLEYDQRNIKTTDNSFANKKHDLDRSFELKNSENQKNIHNTRDAMCRKSDSSDRWSIHSNGERNTDSDYGKYKDDVFDEKNIALDSPYDSSGVSDSNISENNDYHTSSSVNSYNTERKPRPILGAGSRLMQASNRSETEFSEEPALIQAVPEYCDEIPVFCPSIPPPNYIPKPTVKHVTSACQDTGDYWNTPPPPIQSFNLPEPTGAPKMVTSTLSSRLDLNSWRQQDNGAFNNEQEEVHSNVQDVEYYEDNVNNEAVSDSHDIYHGYDTSQPQSNTSLLEKVKNVGGSVRIERADSTSKDLTWNYQKNRPTSQDESSRRHSIDSKSRDNTRSRTEVEEVKQGEWRQRRSEPIEKVAGERKNKPYEKKYDSRDNIKKIANVEESWNETEEDFGSLQIDSNVSSNAANLRSESQRNNKGDLEQNRGNRSSGRQRNDRKNNEGRQERQPNSDRREKDDRDSNWRHREGRQNTNRGNSNKKSDNNKLRERPHKIVQEDENYGEDNWEEESKGKESKPEDKKIGNRREQRGPAKGKRTTMDPPRSGSFWTHDDRCDRDYNIA